MASIPQKMDKASQPNEDGFDYRIEAIDQVLCFHTHVHATNPTPYMYNAQVRNINTKKTFFGEKMINMIMRPSVRQQIHISILSSLFTCSLFLSNMLSLLVVLLVLLISYLDNRCIHINNIPLYTYFWWCKATPCSCEVGSTSAE